MAGEPDTFRISPSTGGLPTFDTPEVRNQNPQQLSQMGEAVQRGGQVAAAIYTDVLQQANRVKIDEAANRLKENALELTYGENGYARLKGRDALFRPDGISLSDEYAGHLTSVAAEIETGLTEPQKKAFKQIADGLTLGMRERLKQHTEREFVTYSVGVNEGINKNRGRELALSGGDPEATANAIASIEAATYELAQLTGNNSAEAIEGMTKAALTPGLVGAVKQFLDDNDVTAAEKYLDLHKDKMTAEGLLAVDAAVGEAQDMKVSTDRATFHWTGADNEAKAAAPQPLIMPVRAGVRSAFGVQRGQRKHGGVDLAVDAGTAVAASAGGVARIKNDPDGYGQYIEIDHGGGMVTRYAHLSSVDIKDGTQVRQGQIIAKSGGAKGSPGAGNSTGPHLHYEVRVNGQAVDPTGNHTVPGAGPAVRGRKSLSAILEGLRADPALKDSPRRLAEAERQIRSMYSVEQESIRIEQQQAQDAAYKALAAAGGDWSKVPASVRSNVQGSDLPGLFSFGKALQQPAGNAEPDLGVYGTVRAKIASGEITTPEQILPYAPQLGQSFAKQLIDDVTGVKKGDQTALDSVKTVKDVMSFVNPQLKERGLDEKENPQEFIAFRGKLLDQIRREERLKGGSLTGDEANNIAAVMMAKTLSGKGEVQNTRGYQLADPVIPYAKIPVGIRTAIEQSLIRRNIQPTRENVQREHYEATRAMGY